MDSYELLRRDILSIGAKYSTMGMTMPEFLKAMAVFMGTAIAVDCRYDEDTCNDLRHFLEQLIERACVQAIINKDIALS